MMKQIMQRAWELAKDGVVKFGGKVKEYFAASLSIAWKEVKSVESNIELIGTEKQVKWANDIIARIEAAQPEMREVASKCGFGPKLAKGEAYLQEALDFIDNLTTLPLFKGKAALYIDICGWVKTEEDVFDLLSTRGLLKYPDVKNSLSRHAFAILEKTRYTLDLQKYREKWSD